MSYNNEQGKRISDAELLRLLAANLDRYFELLVLEYQGMLYRFAKKLTRNEQDAEDMVQNTMISAYKNLKKHPERIPALRPKSWLCQITLNKYIDHYQHTQRQPLLIVIDTSEENPLSELVAGPYELPETALEMAELLHKIIEAIRGLPKDYQESALSYYIEGLSAAEIAQQSAEPYNTIKSRLFRSTRFLRKALKEKLMEEDR